jgi:LysM repeat protein
VAACVAAGLFAAACSTTGVNHVVAPGENLYRIGKAYGVSYDELARVNGIKAPYRLEVGDEVYIPGADRQLPVGVITPSAVSAEPPPNATPLQARPAPTPPSDMRGARMSMPAARCPCTRRAPALQRFRRRYSVATSASAPTAFPGPSPVT